MLLNGICAIARTNFPVAVSSTGIFVGKYKKTIDTLNPRPDTINIEDAREIFAVNVLQLEENLMPTEIQVTGFNMTTIVDGKTISFQTKGSMLSDEMKTHLKNIKPGTLLVFENISILYDDGSKSMVVFLEFTVN